jgi:DNA modification methylase
VIRIICGDARDELRKLPDASVHCCITSPPYLGLRDYGVPATIWGDDDTCEHEWGDVLQVNATNHTDKRRWQHTRNGRDEEQPTEKRVAWLRTEVPQGKFCQRCNAWAGAHGLEPNPDLFVAHEVLIFREVWRVLRPDAVLFVNMGDGYASGGGTGTQGKRGQRRDRRHTQEALGNIRSWPDLGLKPKDLMMMPARVAMALQADGWFLRSQMPWIKRSCMPESVTDRPASAVEYVYLLTKSAKYYWDVTAVKRVGSVAAGTRAAKGSNVRSELKDVNGRPPEYWEYTGARNFRNSDLFFDSLNAPHGLITDDGGDPIALDVNTQPFPGSHFAVFPSGLVEPLIRAGTSEKGCCALCRAPWVRQIERVSTDRIQKAADGWDASEGAHGTIHRNGRSKGKTGVPVTEDRTTGWLASCVCESAVVPCTVLDCFAGAFTTAMVADRLQRDAIGIELSPEYCEMAQRRLLKDAPLLTQIAKAPQRPRLFS